MCVAPFPGLRLGWSQYLRKIPRLWFAILISLEDEWDQGQKSELWEDRAGVLTKHMVGVRRVDGDVDGRDTSSYSSSSSSSSSSTTLLKRAQQVMVLWNGDLCKILTNNITLHQLYQGIFGKYSRISCLLPCGRYEWIMSSSLSFSVSGPSSVGKQFQCGKLGFHNHFRE